MINACMLISRVLYLECGKYNHELGQNLLMPTCISLRFFYLLVDGSAADMLLMGCDQGSFLSDWPSGSWFQY